MRDLLVAAVAPQPFGGDAPGPEHPPGALGKSPVPATLLLAVIPLLVFGPIAVSRPSPAPPIVPTLVQPEGVRVIRLDDTTFRARWRPLYDVPPATVIREVPVATAAVPAAIEASTRQPPARIVRRASLRPTDVCARHGLRKQYYTGPRGWQRWRCRR